MTKLFEKEVCQKCTIHPTMGGFSVEAGSSEASTSATLNTLEPDIGTHSPRGPVVTGLQQDDFGGPGASNSQAKVSHENSMKADSIWHKQQTRALLKDFGLEWIDTDPVATDNEATICSELSPRMGATLRTRALLKDLGLE